MSSQGWVGLQSMSSIRISAWRRCLRTLVLLFLGLSIVLASNFSFLAAAQTAPTATELRGVWLTNVDSDVLFSRANLDRAIQRLQRLNLNTIYPTVWHEGSTLLSLIHI